MLGKALRCLCFIVPLSLDRLHCYCYNGTVAIDLPTDQEVRSLQIVDRPSSHKHKEYRNVYTLRTPGNANRTEGLRHYDVLSCDCACSDSHYWDFSCPLLWLMLLCSFTSAVLTRVAFFFLPHPATHYSKTPYITVGVRIDLKTREYELVQKEMLAIFESRAVIV